jgi:hypothetical protein
VYPYPFTNEPQPPAPPPPPPPPGTLAPSVSLAPQIVSEERYSGTDHLLYPQLHALSLTAAGRAGQLYGLNLAGGDRLSFHRWMLFGYYQPDPRSTSGLLNGSGLFSGGAGYSNQQLAPLTLSLAASQFSWRDIPERPAGSPAPAPGDFTLRKRQRDAQLSLTRAFYNNPVQLFLLLTEDSEPDDAAVAVPLRRLAGPGITASYTGVETTPYTDDRRLFHINATATFYPQQWGTVGFAFTDLRGQTLVTLPLPVSRRHTLRLGLRGRELAGAPETAPMLQVGGAAGGFLFRSSDHARGPSFTSDVLPPGVAFFEPLRGYEDYALATDRVAIVDATYRYPLIIDWGSASTLALLPAFFLRQITLELFYAGALTGRAGERHAAAGAAIGVDFALLIPWSVQYQFARRLYDDQAQVSTIALTTGW